MSDSIVTENAIGLLEPTKSLGGSSRKPAHAGITKRDLRAAQAVIFGVIIGCILWIPLCVAAYHVWQFL